MEGEEIHDGWRSGFAMILAISVATVGMFAGLLNFGSSNFVSAAVVPFGTLLVFAGLPLSIVAIWMGSYGARFGCRTTVGIFHRFEFPGKEASDVGGAGKFLGVPGVAVPLIVSAVVTFYQAQFLALAVLSLAGHYEHIKDTGAYLSILTGGERGEDIMVGAVSIRMIFLSAFVISIVVNLAILNRGIRNGVCLIARGATAVVCIGLTMLALLVVSGGATSSGTYIDGILRASSLDISSMGSREAWIVASVACLVLMLVYAGPVQCMTTFLPKEVDAAKSGFSVVGLMIALIAVLFILVVCPVFAMWTHRDGTALDKIRETGYLKFGGALWYSMAFFSLTAVSAILLKPCQSLFEGELGQPPKLAVWYTAVLNLLLTVPAYFLSKYGYVQELLIWGGIAGFGIFVICSFFAIHYYLGHADFWEDIKACTRMKMPGFVKHILLIVCPLLSLSAVVFAIYHELSTPAWKSVQGNEGSVEWARVWAGVVVVIFAVFCAIVGLRFRSRHN